MSKYTKNKIMSMRYSLWIGGKKIGLNRRKCITSISIKETDEGSDSCTINISDPDMVFINDNIYVENKKIKVKFGWEGFTYRHTFNGYITFVDINFQEDNIPTLTITCMDNTYKMNKKKKKRTFKNKTSAQVVKSIVKDYGYKCVIESGYKFPVQETISQSDQTDIDFISSLADKEVHPFSARLVGDTFYYVKRGKLKKKKMTLTYRDYPHDIISFSPKINTEEKEISNGKSHTKKKTHGKSSGKNKVGSNVSTDSGKGDSGNKNSKDKSSYSSDGSRTYNNNGTWTQNHASKSKK